MFGKKSLSLNAIVNAFKTFLLVVFPLITFPYAAKVLGVEGMGQYNFIYSIVSYFMLLAALGIYNYAIREGAAVRENKEAFSVFASEILEFNIISTVISYLFLFFLCIFWEKLHSYHYLTFVISINIVLTTLGCEWVYAIYEEYLYIAVRSIIFQVLSMIFLFLFVETSNDLILYAVTSLISLSGYNILNIVGLYKRFHFSLQPLTALKKHFLPIMFLFANSIAITIYLNSDITILGIMVGDYSVGLYSVATKVYGIVKAIVASVIIVSIPQMSYLWSNEKHKSFEQLGNNVLNAFMIITLPAIAGINIMSDDIILIIADESYLEASSSLKILSFALLVSVFNWFFQSLILIPSKNEKKVLCATSIAAIVNIVLNLIFIPYFKQDAAAFTTLIAEFVSMIISAFFALKLIKIRVNGRDFFAILFGTFYIVFYSILISLLVPILHYRTIITILGAILGYLIILLLFKHSIITHYLNKIKSQIRHSDI